MILCTEIFFKEDSNTLLNNIRVKQVTDNFTIFNVKLQEKKMKYNSCPRVSFEYVSIICIITELSKRPFFSGNHSFCFLRINQYQSPFSNLLYGNLTYNFVSFQDFHFLSSSVTAVFAQTNFILLRKKLKVSACCSIETDNCLRKMFSSGIHKMKI